MREEVKRVERGTVCDGMGECHGDESGEDKWGTEQRTIVCNVSRH